MTLSPKLPRDFSKTRKKHHGYNINEKTIYLIFFLRDPEQIRIYRSNRLENKFCVVYELPSNKSDNWINNFCKVCYSEQEIRDRREAYILR